MDILAGKLTEENCAQAQLAHANSRILQFKVVVNDSQAAACADLSFPQLPLQKLEKRQLVEDFCLAGVGGGTRAHTLTHALIQSK